MKTEFYDSMSKKTTYKWKGKELTVEIGTFQDGHIVAINVFKLGGGAVDPECGLGDNVHVYSTKIAGKTVFYSVNLALVDIECNKNSYYRLQLLESNGRNM